MSSRVVSLVVAVVGLALAGTAGWWWMGRAPVPRNVAQAAVPSAATAAVQVEVARVQPVRLQDDVQAVGTLRSRQSVVLRPEVAGRVARLGFADGARVRQGQPLVVLDDALQQAEVTQAQAQVSIASANHRRNQELVAQNFVAQRVLDESAANLQVAQAQLALARARLQRMTVVAPFDGTVGIRNVNVGDFVREGTDLVNLENTASLYADFRLPERFQTRLRVGQPVDLQIDALPGRRFEARIKAIDPLLDVNGRSVAVRAVTANGPGQALVTGALPPADAAPLRPGMFARVTVVFAVHEQALVVPEEAVFPQNGQQYVVKVASAASGLVSQRQAVRLGLRREGRVEVAEGLSSGDTVVVAGQQRLPRDGTAVQPMGAASANR